MLLWYIFAFILGTIIGSFLNVLIIRYNTGRSLNGRSGCLSCGKKLKSSELIPVLSYLLQGGRCRGCGSRVSLQYPLVELVTGALFLLIAWQFAPDVAQTAWWWLVATLAVVIAGYDWRHQIIPEGPMRLLGLLAVVWAVGHGWSYLLAGGALFLFFAFLWWVSGGRWMGFGDAKLALAMGWLLGPAGGLSAVAIGFWLGAVVGVSLLLISRLPRLSRRFKLITIKSEMPFAPFLMAGLLSVIVFSWYVIPF